MTNECHVNVMKTTIEHMNLKKISLYQIYCLLFGMFTFFTAVTSSRLIMLFPVGIFLGGTRYLLLLCSVFIIIVTRQKYKVFLTFALISTIFGINFIISGNWDLLLAFLFIYIGIKEDFRKALKSLTYGYVFGIITVILLWAVGVLPHEVDTSGGRVRYYLGFNLPIMLSGFYFYIASALIFLNHESVKIWKALLLLFPGILIFIFTDGRAFFGVLLLAMSLIIIAKNIDEKWKSKMCSLLVRGIKIYYVATFALSLFVAANYHNIAILQVLGRGFTGRFRWFAVYWDLYSPRLFGQYIIRVSSVTSRITGERMMILDNAFLTMTLEFGILISIIISVSIFSLLSYLKEKKDIISIIIWLSIIITFPISNAGLMFWRNPLLFQLAYLLYINRGIHLGTKRIKIKGFNEVS